MTCNVNVCITRDDEPCLTTVREFGTSVEAKQFANTMLKQKLPPDRAISVRIDQDPMEKALSSLQTSLDDLNHELDRLLFTLVQEQNAIAALSILTRKDRPHG